MIAIRSEPVDAVYRSSGVSHYNGNPLTEALPPILDLESLTKRFANRVDPTPEELKEPHYVRMHCVNRLYSIVQPVPFYFAAWESFDQMLRGGYVGRNFLEACVQRHIYGYDEPSEARRDDSWEVFKATSGVMCITGLSGIGKSTLIRQFLMKGYPQIIRHKSYGGKAVSEIQLVWLYFECSHDGSLKQFCLEFFDALDKVLGTNYGERFARLGIPALLRRMRQLCLTYHIGVLVIDELQHISAAKAGGKELLLNFFDNLVNIVGIPLVLVGTYAATSMFSDAIRHSRRVSGDGLQDFVRPARGSGAWTLLVETVWAAQWFTKKNELSPARINLLYDLSQGITDVLVKLMVLSQRRALRAKREEITDADLRLVAANELSLLQPALLALRKGTVRALRLYEDLLPTKEQVELHILAIERSTQLTTDEQLEMLRRQRSAGVEPASEMSGTAVSHPDQSEHAAHEVIRAIGATNSLLKSVGSKSVYDDLMSRGHIAEFEYGICD